ncbi:MAG: hypothetical protein ACI8ZB_005017 [Desulforhopalus sp.]|jgi:hypothetical protein
MFRLINLTGKFLFSFSLLRDNNLSEMKHFKLLIIPFWTDET